MAGCLCRCPLCAVAQVYLQGARREDVALSCARNLRLRHVGRSVQLAHLGHDSRTCRRQPQAGVQPQFDGAGLAHAATPCRQQVKMPWVRA